MFMDRIRHWDYGKVVVIIPVDEPDARPPARLRDVPRHWQRTRRHVGQIMTVDMRGQLPPEQ